MLVYPIAAIIFGTTLSAEAASSTTQPKRKVPTKTDFLKAMDRHARNNSKRRALKSNTQDEFNAEIYGSTKSSAALRKKIIAKSVPAASSSSSGGNVGSAVGGGSMKKGGERNLGYYYQNKYSQENDGSDDYFNIGTMNAFGFDPTAYSASYARCASVKQFDDEMAATEDAESVFVTKHFAVFRFCPKQTCQGFQDDFTHCGCEEQCEVLMEYQEQYGQNGGNADDDGENQEENCQAACYDQCKIWGVQQDLNDGTYDSSNSGYYNRKLADNANGYNWNNYDQNPFADYPFTYGVQDDEEVWGANGEGCQSNYGEYMIELSDYLDLMMEWQDQRFNEYQEYCEDCMFKVYQSQYGRDRDLEAEDSLSFEEFKESQEHRGLGGCAEYDTCRYYMKINQVDEYSEWFECTEVKRNNGQVAYVAPHCAEDGQTITLGVYSDENCYEYIGDGVDVQNWIGEELEEDALRPYYNSRFGPTLEQLQYVREDQVCTPCDKNDLMWDLNSMMDDDAAQNYDQDSEVNELCESLYEASARCDKYYRSYTNTKMTQEYAEAMAQEDLTCDFIDSVVMGSYNELGFVNLKKDYSPKTSGWFSNSMYGQKTSQAISEVSPLQVFGLVASIASLVLLGVWSAALQKSLRKGPWTPHRRRSNILEPKDGIARNPSGIMMGRSASEASYYVN